MRHLAGVLTVIVFVMGTKAYGASFKGYGPQSQMASMTFTEVLERFEETPTDFLILISGHQAFFRFPKMKEHGQQVRDFLKSRMANKKSIVLKIDPETAKVLNLSDP